MGILRLFFKPYGGSGGFAATPVNRVCECVGIKYTYNPGCCDRGLDYYCLGKTKNCRCFNQTKADGLITQYPQGFKIFNKEYSTYQELLDNAYDSCR